MLLLFSLKITKGVVIRAIWILKSYVHQIGNGDLRMYVNGKLPSPLEKEQKYFTDQ